MEHLTNAVTCRPTTVLILDCYFDKKLTWIITELNISMLKTLKMKHSTNYVNSRLLFLREISCNHGLIESRFL